MIDRISAALTEIGIAIAKAKYVESVLRRMQADELKRQRRDQPEPKKES